MKKRNRNKKRSVLSVILSLTLAMSLMTASAFAAEENPEAAGADQAADVTVETVEETYAFDEAGTEDPAAGADQAADSTEESVEETYVTDEAGTEDTDTDHTAFDVSEELTGTPEGIDVDMEEAGDDSLDEEEYGPEALSAEGTEDEEAGEDEEEEDPEIQVFAATEEEQTLKVVQKEEGTIGDDVSFTYHLYQITEAAETIENMGDIISYEPGAYLEYFIVDTDTGEEISDGTTDSEGTFTLHVGETAEFTLEAETDWFVNQDTPESYPLLSVGSDGEYADVVDGTNGVVYYGQIEPEPVQPVISDMSVTSNLDGNEKTYDGGSVILTAGATVTPDTAAVSYQWYKDGVEISGATGSTLTLDGNVSDTGTYKCVVTAENDELTATAEVEVTVTINKAAQNISYAVTEMEKTLGEDPFTNVLTQTTVDGQITYASSDESVATVNAETGEVTILALGEVIITATAAATENYEEATASYTITVLEQPVINELTITSNLTNNEKTYDGEEVILTANTDYIPDTATVAYQWYAVEGDNETEITDANGETLTLTGNVSDSGTYKCVVTVINDGLTATEKAEITITINKAEQDISYEESTVTKIDYDEDFIIELTETVVDGQITYASSDENVATIDPDTGEVHIVGPGYATITATAAETDNYKEATASYVLTVNEDVVKWEIDVNHDQVTWDEENEEWVDDLTYTGEPLELEMAITLTEEEEEELVEITYQWYRYNAETLGFDEIEGATEDAYILEGEDVNAGDYLYMCMAVVTYTNGYAHTVYGPIEVIIEKADQSITFEEESLEAVAGDTITNEIMKEDSVIYGDVTYTSSNESIATVDEETGEVTIVGVGEVTITATAAETENYNAVSAEYTITTSDEVSVTVTSDMDDEDNTKTYDGKEVTLTAKASSKVDGVTYTYQWYTVDESGTETEIEDATEDALTLDGNAADSGTYKCTVTVTYPNDAEPATVSGTIMITINKAPQDISYEETEIEKTDLDDPFTNDLTETTVSDEEGAGITYESSDETVATVDEDGLVTIVGIGEVTITATAVETANYAEATASYTIVVTEGYNVKYAVVIYGINQDMDEDGNILGLTFGPATGTSYIDSYKAHLTEEQYAAGEGICLHWMSWEEIIEQSLEDPTVFQTCLENGCTHSVNITLNDTLLATNYTGKMDGGDGAGYLYNSISSNYRSWNSSGRNAGGWPASQVRAVLNGKDDQTGSYAEYALDASDCLFSCFPSVLQDAIVAKAVKSDTVYNSQTEADNKTTYDKLWLFSGKELYGDSGSNNDVIRTYEGELYQRSEALGITTSNYGGLNSNNETGGNSYWWLRSISTGGNFNANCVSTSGGWAVNYASNNTLGLAPGFCLAGPEVEQPVINGVTITTTGLTSDNTKTYDGDEVTLTAVVDYTPDTATITYQWYKMNEAGEYTEIEGADEDILTLDGNVSDTGTYKCEVTVTNGGFTISDYAEITITIKEATVVKYAVKLWGICTDTYSYDEGSTLQTASLTFGPATGANHLNSYVECSSDTCIHKLSWDEIIAYCNEYQGNSEMLNILFGSCLENGCTKAVELTPNDTLFNMTAVNNALEQGYTGDGVSTLYYLLNGTGSTSYTYAANWNQSYTGNSSSDPANIYSRSRIRATLTGDSADAREWVANSYNDYYGVDTLCDESNCLLSCFPAELQAAVVPRTTLNTGNTTEGTSANDKTTYDKLFLFSLEETGAPTAYDDGGGSDYGVNPDDSARAAYEFSDTSATNSSSRSWWLRSRSVAGNNYAGYVYTNGHSSSDSVTHSYGLSPGFCIK